VTTVLNNIVSSARPTPTLRQKIIEKIKSGLITKKLLINEVPSKNIDEPVAVINEKIDLSACKYILSKIESSGDLTEFNITDKAVITKITLFCQKHLDSTISKDTEYIGIESRYNYKNKIIARYYTDTGIQYLPANIRGFLVKDLPCTDLDISSCHPTILLWLASQHNISSPTLTRYCNDKDNFLNEIQIALGISRQDAKQELLKLLNQDAARLPKIEKSDLLNNFKRDVSEIQTVLYSDVKYKFIKEFVRIATKAKSKSGAKNEEPKPKAYVKKSESEHVSVGKFTNYLMSHIEGNIVLILLDFLSEINIQTTGLFYDGVLLTGDYYNDASLRQEASNYIKAVSGIDLTFSYKPHDDSITIDAGYKERKYITYDAKKTEFEKTQFKVRETYYTTEKDGDFRVSNSRDFIEEHRAVKYYDQKTKSFKSFIKKWIDDDNHRNYTAARSLPPAKVKKELGDTEINMWTPLRVESESFKESLLPLEDTQEIRDAGINRFRDHVKKILCDNNNELFEFAEVWIAQMLQYPENKSLMLIFYSSMEGVGKGLFFQFLQAIIGANKAVATGDPKRDLFSRFNDKLSNKLLILIDEANRAAFHQEKERLKVMITEPTLSVESKGIKTSTIDSYHRFLAFTNNYESVPITERRTVMIKCGNGFKDLKAGGIYYRQLAADIANDVIIDALYKHYNTRPTFPMLTKEHIPNSSYQNELTRMSEPIVVKWFRKLINIELTIGGSGLSPWKNNKFLFASYKRFLSDEHPNINDMTERKWLADFRCKVTDKYKELIDEKLGRDKDSGRVARGFQIKHLGDLQREINGEDGYIED
tara:strand:- start:275 stop:2734 length:2460 start_codon:yes stop_codon:yes gene_type:complete